MGSTTLRCEELNDEATESGSGRERCGFYRTMNSCVAAGIALEKAFGETKVIDVTFCKPAEGDLSGVGGTELDAVTTATNFVGVLIGSVSTAVSTMNAAKSLRIEKVQHQ